MSDISKQRIFKLTNSDIIIGNSVAKDDTIVIDKPYTVHASPDGPQLMPYQFHILLEAMNDITIRSYDIMWNKALTEFPIIEAQYISATTGVIVEPEHKIIL